MKTILMNPGPVNVSARVRDALAGPDLCHREPEFLDLQDTIRDRLLEAFGVREHYTSVLLTGSGTAMVEAMIASALPERGRLLVLQNGVYGDRMARIARVHSIPCDVIECPITERHNLEGIDTRLLAERYSALAVVHHETTTGLLNDVAAIAELCRRRNVRLLVDAVSSLAGERFNFERWAPDAVACTANKCVQGLPGLSFSLVRREFMDAMASFPERTLYLHLPRHFAAQEKRSTPFTPAVQVGYALRAALDELCEETVESRIARYSHATTIIRRGLTSLGFELLLPEPLRSTTMTAVRLPLGESYEHLHDALKRSGFVIYAGQGPLAKSIFRVAAMGDVARGRLPAVRGDARRRRLMSVQEAIILAAGVGARLRAVVDDRPKGLIEIGGRSLVGRSVALLRTAGIQRITIVTGYCAEAYQAFADSAPDIRLIRNDAFDTTGSMASLAIALDATRGRDVLILESDIVYESRALAALLSNAPDATVISGPTGAGDEVWVSSQAGRLCAMSKQRDTLTEIAGEFVGLTRLSAATCSAMLETFHRFVSMHGHARMDYETGGLVEVAASRAIATLLIADLCWGEIDDERQYARVVQRVWPRVQ